MSRPRGPRGQLDPDLLAELRTWSTPSVINGLKRLGVPPAQFRSLDRHAVGCVSPELGVTVGYAVTRRVRTRREGRPPDPAITARMLLCEDLLAVAAPRIVVIETVGDTDGPVCILGELAATVDLAHDCGAGITNGPVRDVAEMAALGFQAFAGGVGVGGGYVDLLASNEPVTVGGVQISPGELVHGDGHGVVVVPADLAVLLPAAMAEHARYEQAVMDACRTTPLDRRSLARALGIEE